MYTFGSRIRYSETDEYGKLTLTGIMNYLQDCSTFQSEDIGLGISYLTEHHQAWWLSSWQIVIDRYPALGEEVVIGTWRLEMEYAPRKITVPADYVETECVTIAKHHIDTNHHVNNAQYVEIAREVLPAEIEVGELRVEYKKAAVCGDVVYPHVSRTDEGYTVSLCDEQGAAYAVIWLRGKTREDII